MENIRTILRQQNTRTRNEVNRTREPNSRRCNCRQPDECPLRGNCLSSGIVYRATESTNGSTAPMHCISSTDKTFKRRYANHKASMTHPAKANQTALSKYVWTLKRSNTNYQIDWKILQHATAYSHGTKRCDLCTTEKLIARAEKQTLLNKRSELLSRCRHRKKFCLSNFVK